MSLLLPLVVTVTTVCGQTSVTRVCSLQVVLDNFLWSQQKEKLRESGGNITEVELDRITRCPVLISIHFMFTLPAHLLILDFHFRFHLISLISRVVNEANKVLDSYYFNNSKFKLSLKNLQVHIMIVEAYKYQQHFLRSWKRQAAHLKKLICV